MRFPKRFLFVIAAATIGFLGMTLALGAKVEAHSGSFWAGTHYTNTAACYYFPNNGFQMKTFVVQPPTVYATRNDSNTDQLVAWRPRAVMFRTDGTAVNVAVGSWQYAKAYDTQPAQFASQTIVAYNTLLPVYVAIDFAFYSTTTGALADQPTHWAPVDKWLPEAVRGLLTGNWVLTIPGIKGGLVNNYAC